MLEPAFNSLKDFFSRTFLISRFLPAFIFVLLNTLLIALAANGIAAAITLASEHLKITELATAVAIATLIAITLAFTLSPLLGYFILLLEGKPLPGPVRKAMIEEARKQGGDVSKEAEQYRSYLATAYSLRRDMGGRFAAAIAASPATAIAAEAVEAARRSVDVAKSAMTKVQANADGKAFNAGDLLGATTSLADAGVKLEAALAANAKLDRLDPTAPNEQKTVAAQLAAVHSDYAQLLLDTVTLAASLLRTAESHLTGMMVASDPQPTRFGNLRAQLRDYCRTVYKVEYDYLWPRLRLVIGTEEEDKSRAIEDAQAQFDFSLMMMMLLLISAVAWFAWLIATGDRPRTILAAGVATPSLLIFFYETVLESQRQLTQMSAAAIDRYRLKLLEALNVKPPTGYQDELARWRTLEAISNGYLQAPNAVVGADLDYKP